MTWFESKANIALRGICWMKTRIKFSSKCHFMKKTANLNNNVFQTGQSKQSIELRGYYTFWRHAQHIIILAKNLAMLVEIDIEY